MDFEKNRIEDLRKRLRSCYAFRYRDDKKKLGYLKSEKTSESNPFIRAISVDLRNRFKEVDSYGEEKQTGFSAYTLKDIFFNYERVNYDKDAIPNLELFCSEVELEINNETNSKTQIKAPDYSKSFFKKSLIFFLFIIIVITLIWVIKNNIFNKSEIISSSKSFEPNYMFIRNHTQITKGAKELEGQKQTIGFVGDTIVIIAIINNITKEPISYSKFSMSPRVSSGSLTHTFYGKISDSNKESYLDNVSISTIDNSLTVRNIGTVVTTPTKETEGVPIELNDLDENSLFSDGIIEEDIYPSVEKSVVIQSVFVVEQ